MQLRNEMVHGFLFASDSRGGDSCRESSKVRVTGGGQVQGEADLLVVLFQKCEFVVECSFHEDGADGTSGSALEVSDDVDPVGVQVGPACCHPVDGLDEAGEAVVDVPVAPEAEPGIGGG